MGFRQLFSVRAAKPPQTRPVPIRRDGMLGLLAEVDAFVEYLLEGVVNVRFLLFVLLIYENRRGE
jgi:hypothetical protein